MLFRDVIELITTTESENEQGDVVSSPSFRLVFANKKSIRQTEFYQAQATGLKPELMFEIRTDEYNEETQLRFNDKTYSIIRTHDKNGEIMELICSGLVVK